MTTPPDVSSRAARREFIPAKPAGWFIKTAQTIVRAELALNNRLHFEEQDLEVFRKLPPGSGIVLTSNHADETDPRVCLELSRRSGKRFIFMCNREAFDEILGLAGWALQRLGLFSVMRGAHDHHAKTFATNVVKQGSDVLVIFPEGEIFYLNEVVQPFHSGAIDICLEAIVENRKTDPNWTAYIVPMVIKYHYSEDIEGTLEKRIARIEAHLSMTPAVRPVQERILAIQKTLIEREALLHHVIVESAQQQDLTQEIISIKEAILTDVEQRHGELQISKQASEIDQAWQLGAEIKEIIDEKSDQACKIVLEQDLAALTEVAQLSSWQPHYYSESPSADRLAEAVLKLERELFRIKRPRQLANRNVTVKLADPIDMGPHVSDYLQDAHSVRHRVTEQLHEQIQSLLDKLKSRSQS